MNNIDRVAWAHVYGQFIYHAPATIRGNRDALIAIRDAIDRALETGEGSAALFAADGEGYPLNIVCTRTMATLGRPEYQFEKMHRLDFEEVERRRQYKLGSATR